MPVVIPAGASSSSSSQVVATSNVYDYIQTDAGVAIPNILVTAILNGEFTTTIAPQVLLSPTTLSTTTDANGFWSLNLIPNSNISPANTTYSIKTPFRTYDITVGVSGPYQSTSLGTLVDVPATLGPATSSISGPLTVSGAFTATGGATISNGLTVTGALSLPGATMSLAGPITLTAATSRIIPGATSMSIRNNAGNADNLLISNAGLVTARAGLVATAGGLTVTAGGAAVTGNSTVTGTLTVTGDPGLTLSAAAARIVPGVTSLALRNTANNADNVFVSDAGAVTIRAGLTITASGETITAGNLTLTAGNLVFVAASAKILPGATSLLVRNNADSASNIAITDAGIATYRNAIEVPNAAGATLPTHTYGTLPVKIDEQSPAAAATVTIPASGSLPTGFRNIMVEWTLRGDTAATNTGFLLQFNGVTTNTYDREYLTLSAAVVTATEALTQNGITVGFMPANTATANYVGQGEFNVLNYNSVTADKVAFARSWAAWADTTTNQHHLSGGGKWRTTNAAITTLTLSAFAGNITGTIVTYGIP